jgi:hypothetical protein
MDMVTFETLERMRVPIQDRTINYICEAVEALEEPNEIRQFYNALIDLNKEDLQKGLEEGRDSDVFIDIWTGKRTLEGTALSLTNDHFAYILNKYYGDARSRKIHKKWKQALPELYCINGKLPNILGFSVNTQ